MAQVLGQNLRERRRALGLSQKDVAEEAGMDGADLSRLESGRGGERGVGLDRLSRLAKALSTEPAALLGHEGSVEQTKQ